MSAAAPAAPSHREPILTLEHVSYRFKDGGRGRAAYGFRDVSLLVAPGEFLSIVGPSGCGKSTLLRVMAGLVEESEGQVAQRAARVAMVFQGHGLFPWLTALGNVAFGLKMQGLRRVERERIAREKLREVGLGGFERRYPHELSGGQRQRVSIARALAVSPDLLLLDEPFASLDSATAGALKRDLAEILDRYPMTVVMVSHIIADAVELSDRVAVMSGGPGQLREIVPVRLAKPRDARSGDFFAQVDRLTAMIER